MPEPESPGFSRLDADRARSMEDEGGASAALAYRDDVAAEAWAASTAMACLVGLLAGMGLVMLLRSR